MTVTPFPAPRSAPIDDPLEIARLEQLISAVAGLVSASGGHAALAGRDLYDMSVEARALLLTDMYDAGEVIFGWRDARTGEVVNAALCKLVVRTAASAAQTCWRAELYVEEAEGHMLRGAYVEPDLDALSARLTAAVGAPLAPPSASEALAAFVRRAG